MPDPFEIARRKIAEAKETGATTLDLSSPALAAFEFPYFLLEDCEQDVADQHRLQALPEELWSLASLKILTLGYHELTVLPDAIGKLTALEQLDLSGNQLASLPDAIGKLTTLKILDLSDNQFADLPNAIENLSVLKTLGLGGNQLPFLPDAIVKLTALKVLDLSYNQFADLPNAIGKLTTLELLELSGNQLADLPNDIEKLTALKILDLGENQFADLPNAIMKLTALEKLDLRGNQFANLPNAIGKLNALESLSLIGNQLTYLPDAVEKLNALESLDLKVNQLTDLPNWLADIKTLKFIDAFGNPLCPALTAAERHGVPTLQAFLSAREGGLPQREAKLVLVGEGGVGKSCLAGVLRGEGFKEDLPSTHGMELAPVEIDAEDGPVRFNAWDFGGQEVYRAGHQAFFSEDAVYLLLFDGRQELKRGDVEGWLRRLRLNLADRARVLLVATHGKDWRASHDIAALNARHQGVIRGPLHVVDSATGQGVQELKAAILDEARAWRGFGEILPAAWHELRDALFERPEPDLAFDKYLARADQALTSSVLAETWLRVLHQGGRLLWYGDSVALRHAIVTKPEWIGKAIAYVVEDEGIKEAKGVVAHQRLDAIWAGDNPEGEVFPSDKRAFLLELLERFDVSRRLDGRNDHSLIPASLPFERPPLPWNHDDPPPVGHGRMAVVAQLSDIVPGLIPMLICRTFAYTSGTHWRYGALLRQQDGGEALFELRETDRQDLRITVRAPYPAAMMHLVRSCFETLIEQRTLRGLDLTWYVLCNPNAQRKDCDGENRFELRVLHGLRTRGRDAALCHRCFEEHSAARLLEGLAPPTDWAAPATKEDIRRVEAQNASFLREWRRFASNEVTDTPRTAIIRAKRPEGLEWLQAPKSLHFTLQLVCEEPGREHPVGGPYTFEKDREWFAKIAPLFRLAMGAAKFGANAAMPGAGLLFADAETESLVRDFAGDLRSAAAAVPDWTESNQDPGGLRGAFRADGAALHELRRLLREKDSGHFQGLRPHWLPTGELLWLCPEHLREREPPPEGFGGA